MIGSVSRSVETTLGRAMAGEDVTERLRPLINGIFDEDPHPSEILATRSRADGRYLRLGELWDDMPNKDPDLAALWVKRGDAVFSLPLEIRPYDNTDESKEIAEFCYRWLSIVPGIEINLRHQHDGTLKGVSFDELIWGRVKRGSLAGALVPLDIIDRPMWRFGFKNGELFIRQADGKPPVYPPEGKFLVFTQGTKDSRWGRALLEQLYWYWFIKKHAMKYWAHFIEKHAAPTLKGHYATRTGTDAEALAYNQRQQAAMLAMLEAIQGNSSVAIPENVKVEFLQAATSANFSYAEFVAVCTRPMALLLLGEINTSGLRPGTGAYASDAIADDIRKEKVSLDAKDLGAHFRKQLLRPMVEVNFGPDAPVPFWEYDTLDTEDREQRREGIKMLRELNLPIVESHAYRVGLTREPREGEKIIAARQLPAAGEGFLPRTPTAEPDLAANRPPSADAAGSGVSLAEVTLR